MEKIKQPNIYAYSDFRVYLQNFYEWRSQISKNYSYRTMSKELGFPSPNYIKLVIDGQRNIGLKSIDRLMRGLGLDDKEQEYFSYLVFFCQAKSSIEKNYYFGLMSSIRIPQNVATITNEAYRFYSEWYHCVVRELIVREKTPVDFSVVAGKIKPHVTATQVKKSVELLLELGFIKRNNDGSYYQSSRLLATDNEVISVGVRNYHYKMIELAKDSIDTTDRDKREVSSVTICTSDEAMARIKKRIQEFEEEILQIAHNSTDSKHVYQLNMQFFPLTEENDQHA